MARLAQWSDEQRDDLLDHLAYNCTVMMAFQLVQDKYKENLHPYSYNAVKAYIQSEQGKQDYLRVLGDVKKAVKERGFGDADHRLTGLAEVALALLEKFRIASEANDWGPMGTLSREFRECMRAIREEVGPITSTTSALSYFERMQEAAAILSDKEHTALFGDDKGIDVKDERPS